jgi:hypothetical protein
MRGYVAMTAIEVADFLATAKSELNDLYAPTAGFTRSHPDLGEEEAEYLLSMLAAEEALELTTDGEEGTPCVLAFEIPTQLIATSTDLEITISEPLNWDYLQCLFTVTSHEDGELELTWFAPQEISIMLSEWLA